MPLRPPLSFPLRRRRTALLVLASAVACAVRRAGVPDDVPDWLRADPQRCLLGRDLGENMEAMARRCAELFVPENGYTDLPATDDSTRWVLEAGERGRGWGVRRPGRHAGAAATTVHAASGNASSSSAAVGCPSTASTARSP